LAGWPDGSRDTALHTQRVAARVINRELDGLLIGATRRLVVQAERNTLRSGDDLHLIRGKLGSGRIALPEDQETHVGQRLAVVVFADLQERRIMRLAPLYRHTNPSLGQVRSGHAGGRLPAEEVQLGGPPAGSQRRARGRKLHDAVSIHVTEEAGPRLPVR